MGRPRGGVSRENQRREGQGFGAKLARCREFPSDIRALVRVPP